MKQVTTAPLSTLLYDEQEGNYRIRLSIWVDPEDVEVESAIDERQPTISVMVQKGRRQLFGKIDRKAYKAWLTKDTPAPVKPVPMPTDGTVTFRERMYR